MRELRPLFLDLKADFASGNVPVRWTKASDEYNRLSREGVTPLSRFEDLESRYEIWRLDEKSALQRELKKLELYEAAELEDGVLRVRAPLPGSMYRKDCLKKLLYLIHDGVDKKAVIVRSNSEVLDATR